MAKSFCTKCGAQVEEDATFCTSCGASIAAASVPHQQAPETQQFPQTAPLTQQAPQPVHSAPKKSKTPIAIIVVACIVIVVAAILAVVFVVLPGMDGSGSSSSSSTTTSAGNAGASGDTGTATGTSAQAAPVFPYVSVSTQLPGDADTADYGATNLTDGLSDTAWNEGAPGDGVGEWIRFYANTPQRVSSVRIMGGFPKLYKDGSDVYAKNPRPKEITISYDNGAQTFTMQDLRGEFQTFNLVRPVDTTEITITIDSVYPGTKYNDCCIAEVEFQ